MIVVVILIFLNFKSRPTVEINTFQSEKGWGYDIIVDGAQYIHQPNIPALSGDFGFDTEMQARSVAKLVVKKIRKNILPPGVTPEEVNIAISN